MADPIKPTWEILAGESTPVEILTRQDTADLPDPGPVSRYQEDWERRQRGKDALWTESLRQHQSLVEQLREEARGNVEAAAREGKLLVSKDQVDPEALIDREVDFTDGTPADVLKDSSPDRYFFDYDLATGDFGYEASDLGPLLHPVTWYTGRAELAETDEEGPPGLLLDAAQQVGPAIMHGFLNGSRAFRDQIVPHLPPQPSTLQQIGWTRDQWDASTIEQRRHMLKWGAGPEAIFPPSEESHQRLWGVRGTGETWAGQATHAIVQYMTGFALMAATLRGFGVAPGIARDLVAGAAASAIVWDDGVEALANMLMDMEGPEFLKEHAPAFLQDFSSLLLKYLATDEDDSDLERRLKLAADDVLATTAAVGFLAALRKLKDLKIPGFGAVAAGAIEGYQFLRRMNSQRGAWVLRPGKALDEQEMKAFSNILAIKYAQGKVSKAQFRKSTAHKFSPEDQERLWDRARRIGSPIREEIRKLTGAPWRTVRSPAQRQQLLDMYDTILRESPIADLPASRKWYIDSGVAIRELAGNDPDHLERLLRLTSVYSAANGVPENTRGIIAALEPLARGEIPPAAGSYRGQMAPRLPAILDLSRPFDRGLPGVGEKVQSFYRNLSDEARRTSRWTDEVTVDRWVLRALGYTTDNPKPQQYAWAREFIQDLTAQVNARTGDKLRPRDVQAALWHYTKQVWEQGGKIGDQINFGTELARPRKVLTDAAAKHVGKASSTEAALALGREVAGSRLHQDLLVALRNRAVAGVSGHWKRGDAQAAHRAALEGQFYREALEESRRLGSLSPLHQSVRQAQLNASGESAASLEALRVEQSRKAQGITHWIVDSRTGKPRPAIGPRPEDAALNPYDVLVQWDGTKSTTMNLGSKAKAPNPERLKAELTKAGRK